MMSKAEEYKLELLNVINEKKIAFLDHAFAFTSFSRSTAYNNGLDKLDSIKDALRKNRVKAKAYMLNKWIESDNATLQLAAYRLCADTEEHQKLNQQYIDHTSKGEKIQPAPIVFYDSDDAGKTKQ
mgnify:CR=1 FL=1